MKNKEEKLTFDELVDGCAEIILRHLMKGEFRSGVRHAVHWVWMWTKEDCVGILERDKRCPICKRKVKKKV